MRDAKLHAVVARSTFESQNVENTLRSDRFWKLRRGKVHAVVAARSTFQSKNNKSTTCSDPFWKLTCRKSACRCCAKHISKSKCRKHLTFGPLLEVEMSKQCAPLWRSTFRSQNAKSTSLPEHFWKLWCGRGGRRCGAKHIWKPKCTKHTMFGALLEVELSKSARRCGAKHISKSKY